MNENEYFMDERALHRMSEKELAFKRSAEKRRRKIEERDWFKELNNGTIGNQKDEVRRGL